MSDWDKIRNIIMNIEPERRRRIRVAVAAYAYEVESKPVMSDSEYDELALSIDTRIETGHDVLDEFFRTDFSPVTGQWVYNHPERDKLRDLYHRVYKNLKPKTYDQKNNHDLFGPLLNEPETIQSPCNICGKDITKNPIYGGCHC